MTQRERQILQWIEADPMISQEALAERAGITRSSVAVHISNLMKKGYIAGKGYVLRSGTYAAVVGGVNIDIGGRSDAPLVAGDSNPGRIRSSLGGVGRNIAHNLALLGAKVRLITALGADDGAKRIEASCADLGIDLTDSLYVPDGATSTYLFLADSNGDMALAMNDMAIYEQLTPAFLETKLTTLNAAALVVLDTNPSAESIRYLGEHCTAPLFADPVSAAKAGKLEPILGRLYTLKPNRMEAELLSGVTVTDEASLYRAADTLLAAGLQRVFISLGADGVLAADHERKIHLHNLPARMVNTTGCGDAFMAAVARAFLDGAVLAASAIAMESADTINPALSLTAVAERIQ